MTAQTKGIFEIASWDEKTWDGKPAKEVSGVKLTAASITHTFHGVIEGEGTLRLLMTYREDGTAKYVGYEQVIGSIDGLSGSFVLEHYGVFDGSVAKTKWIVVPGSGTDDLHGLRGEGGYIAGHEQPIEMTLNYYLDSQS